MTGKGLMAKVRSIWSDLDEPVSRKTYFGIGTALAAVKYAFDAALIWIGTGRIWTPLDYFVASASWEQSGLAGAPTWLLATLGLSTIPFVRIGLTLSIRRALDAGLTPWLGLLFFVPLVNYAFIAVMSLWPSSRAAPTAEPSRALVRQPNALPAIASGSALSIGLVLLFVLGFDSYGAGLFFGGPFTVGAVTGYMYNRGAVASFRSTLGVLAWTLGLGGLALIGVALEGAICLLLAAPLLFGIGAIGASAGREIARLGAPARGAMIAVLVAPLSAPMDGRAPVHLHEVRSVIEIAAPPDVVWHNVVSFAELPPPTEIVFRAGISYPMRARIEGTGVGAVRYCEFSTGAFVEPITRWEPGTRLSFDVVKQPPPMREWSPYRIAPPHLDGWFAARRGELRLVPLENGNTRLEGSTWYVLEIQPTAYWTPLADALVGTIHERVLRHIKSISESPR